MPDETAIAWPDCIQRIWISEPWMTNCNARTCFLTNQPQLQAATCRPILEQIQRHHLFWSITKVLPEGWEFMEEEDSADDPDSSTSICEQSNEKAWTLQWARMLNAKGTLVPWWTSTWDAWKTLEHRNAKLHVRVGPLSIEGNHQRPSPDLSLPLNLSSNLSATSALFLLLQILFLLPATQHPVLLIPKTTSQILAWFTRAPLSGGVCLQIYVKKQTKWDRFSSLYLLFV